MMKVALTGNVASGKSTVARIWTEAGVEVVQADDLAREVVRPGSEGLAQVVQAVATITALGYLVNNLEYKWTLTVGAACWLVLFLAYVAGKSRALVACPKPRRRADRCNEHSVAIR